MAKYRKLPVVIDAVQWFKNGDHASVLPCTHKQAPYDCCGYCGQRMSEHGWIGTLEGEHIVCPGDWIITGVAGEVYPCKPDIFKKTYEQVED